MTTTHHQVRDWAEANQKVAEITAGGTRALGSGSSYPEDYTLMYHDCLSGAGAGYTIWRNQNGEHIGIYAIIDIVAGAQP